MVVYIYIERKKIKCSIFKPVHAIEYTSDVQQFIETFFANPTSEKLYMTIKSKEVVGFMDFIDEISELKNQNKKSNPFINTLLCEMLSL